MDNSSPSPAAGDRAPRVQFVPDRRYTVGAAAGALLALVALALSSQNTSRLLAVVAAVVLAGYVVSDLVFRPRLVASAAGVRIRTPALRADLAWSQIEAVRVDVRARYGLRSSTLEIDAGPVLAVLSGRTLGTDPQQAADLVNALRPG